MDFTLKGKSWAGNIYHQFESICQDVDDFVSKDTVKYVENQVQSVGLSVKKLYSSVVQEILPIPGDDVKSIAQSLVGKQADMNKYVNSVPAIKTESSCVDEKQSWMEQGSINTVTNSSALLRNELDHVVPTMASAPSGSSAVKIDSASCNSISDDVECLSNVSGTGWSFEGKLPRVKDPDCNENRSLSAPFVLSVDKVHDDNGPFTDSPLSSACDEAHGDLGKDGSLCDRFPNKDESFDVSLSVQSPDPMFLYFSCDDEAETGFVTSSFSTSPKSPSNLESTSVNFSRNVENVCISHTDPHGGAYNVSTSASTNAASENAAVDLPAFSMLELSGSSAIASSVENNHSSSTDKSVPLVGSSQNSHEIYDKDASSTIAILPSETVNTHEVGVGIGDLNMETVDLSTNMKHDGRNAIFSRNIFNTASHKRRNFRYYKKLIQDAFASRKRLSKEYEHLAILYGDIDDESRQQFEPSSLPSSPTSLHAARARSFQETGETEWELL